MNTGGEDAAPNRWVLTLYVSGASPNSAAAVEAVRALCRTELADRVELQVVDVRDDPARLARDQVLATPTLIKRLPPPLRRLVGDLSDLSRVRIGLSLDDVLTGAEPGRPDPWDEPDQDGRTGDQPDAR